MSAAFKEATRVSTGLLTTIERRCLLWIAARIPPSINADHLTSLAGIAMLVAGCCYGFARQHRAALLAVPVMLAVNWFGDSLDGTLARVRGAERPKYGFYLDHVMGALSVVCVGLGIGFSGYVSLSLALGAVVGYLALAVNVYLESSVFGIAKIEYGRIGPTEARLALIVLNTIVALGARPPVRVVNWAFAIVLAAMVVVFVWRLARNLARLARQEPQR